MMAKKKRKKTNKGQHQAMLRASARQQESIFWQKLSEVAEAIGAGDVVDHLPEKEKQFLLTTRLRPLQVHSMEEVKLPNKLLKVVQSLIHDFLTSRFFSFPGSDKQFMLMDYFTIVFTIMAWIQQWEKKDERPDYIRAFKPVSEFYNKDEKVLSLFVRFLHALGNSLAMPGQVVYYLEFGKLPLHSSRLALIIKLKAIRPERTSVTFNGATRPVHLLSFNNINGPCYVTMKAGLLNPRSPKPEKKKKVFIQNHALERLRERVDCFSFGPIYLQMCETFDAPEIVSRGKHRALVSFYYEQVKIGYFAIQEYKDMIVIRTFLFLTNDHTPEGNLLKERLGLARKDKEYNRLDKLSTFLLSDIREDEELCSLLQDTGCGSLLHWDDKVRKTIRCDDSLAMPTAESIKNYLMLRAS